MEKFNIAEFEVEAFPVSHDAPETVGFHIFTGGKKITIATDLGYISHDIASYITCSNLLVLESNYDENMLVNGRYPWYLKTRIKSDRGHLGNHQASSFLAENINDNLTNICLAHLSINNNTPELVMEALQKAFSERGISLNGSPQVTILKRHAPSDVINLI